VGLTLRSSRRERLGSDGETARRRVSHHLLGTGASANAERQHDVSPGGDRAAEREQCQTAAGAGRVERRAGAGGHKLRALPRRSAVPAGDSREAPDRLSCPDFGLATEREPQVVHVSLQL
jgi:hypothetical protein